MKITPPLGIESWTVLKYETTSSRPGLVDQVYWGEKVVDDEGGG